MRIFRIAVPAARIDVSRAVVTVALLTLLPVACSSSSGGTGTAALGDGFSVPAGTELLAGPTPNLASYVIADTGAVPHRAWDATLSVTGGARSVYRDLARQARATGITMTSVKDSCKKSPDPGADGTQPLADRHGAVTCSGRGGDSAYTHGASVSVEIVGCALCEPSVGIARLHFDAGSGTAPKRKVTGFTVVDRSPRPDRAVGWTRLTGTRVLADVSFFACQRNRLVVLAVTGRADDVWRHALAGGGFDGATATIRGHHIRYATQPAEDPWALTMDEGSPASTLTITNCEG